MAVLDEETIQRIKSQLRHHPKGMMISDLSRAMNINRNIMSKYLDILLISGEVEMEMRGNAKMYTLSRRVPLSTMFDSSSDYIILLDGKSRMLWLNTALLSLLGKMPEDFAGKRLGDAGDPFLQCLPYQERPDSGETVSEITCPLHDKIRYFRVKQTPAVLANGSMGSILSCEDITAESIYKQMVEISEARFRAIVEDQTELIVRFLPNGALTFANGSYARMMGKTPEQLVGNQFFLTMPEDDMLAFRQKIWGMDSRNSVVNIECRVLPDNGPGRRQQWTVRVLIDSSGKITEYQGVGRDITEQAEAQERLRGQAADLEFISRKGREFLELPQGADIYAAIGEGLSEIVPEAAICVSSCDSHSRVFTIRNVCGIGARDTFRRMSGTDIIGLSFTINDPAAIEFVRIPTLHKAYGNLYNALFGQMPYLLCKQLEEALDLDEIYILGVFSQDRLIGCATILLKKGHGIPNTRLVEAFIHQSSLVLAWRLADESLQQSEARFRAIVEEQAEFITRFLPDGTLTFVNAPLCRAVNMPPADLLGRSFFSMIPDDARQEVQTILQSLSRERPKATIRHRIIDPDGQVRWFEWVNRVIFDDAGRPVEYDGVGRDITVLQDAASRIRKHPADIRFLSQHAKGLIGMEKSQQILAFTTKKIRSVIPNSIVGVCSYRPESNQLVFRHIDGGPEALNLLNHDMHRDLHGAVLHFEADPDMIARFKSGHLVPGTCHIGTFLQFMSPEACSRVAERLNLGRSYLMALPSTDGTIETVVVQLETGAELQNPELLEAAINQAGLALARVQGRG